MNLKILKRNKIKKENSYKVRLKNAEQSRYDCLVQRDEKNVFLKIFGVIINICKRIFFIGSYSFLFFFVSIAIENAFASAFVQNPFAIQLIDIQNNVVVEDEDIFKACKIKTDENILTLNIGDIKQKVENIDNIKNATVMRDLPGKLLIKVEERIPCLRMIIGGELLDSNGKEVKVKNGYLVFKHLPVIDGVSINSEGMIVEEDLDKYKKTLDINLNLKESLSMKDPVVKIESFKEWSDFTLNSGVKLRIPYDYDEIILKKVKVVLNDCYKKNGSTLPKLIDLRYNKNVFVKF